MRRHNPPTHLRAHPGLALPPSLVAANALEFDVDGGRVPAIGGNHVFQHRARQPLRRARGTEGANGVIAVQVFGHTVAQSVRTAPEQFVKLAEVAYDATGGLNEIAIETTNAAALMDGVRTLRFVFQDGPQGFNVYREIAVEGKGR